MNMNDRRRAVVPAFRIAALVMVLAFSSLAHICAQTEKGSLEAGLEAGPFFFITTGGHETVGDFGLSLEPHLSYFFTDDLSAGAAGFFYHTSESDASQPSISFGGAFANANYHFSSGSTWSPYIGGRVGVFKPNSEMQFAVGTQIGLQYLVAPQFSVNGELDIDANLGSESFGLLSSLGLGVSYHLR